MSWGNECPKPAVLAPGALEEKEAKWDPREQGVQWAEAVTHQTEVAHSRGGSHPEKGHTERGETGRRGSCRGLSLQTRQAVLRRTLRRVK